MMRRTRMMKVMMNKNEDGKDQETHTQVYK